MKKQRVIVYVDGFNFYYGIKRAKWRQFYWLDIVAFFEQFMRADQELIAVKYFSAKIANIDKSKRQDAFFQANSENPKFKLILGKYLKKSIVCHKCGNNINTYEEKESDVRIATQVIADAYQDNCDISIIVSADSDMAPAIELATEKGNSVFVYFPPCQHSSNLSSISHVKPVLLQKFRSRFKKALLPEKITLKQSGYELTIPKKWRLFSSQER